MTKPATEATVEAVDYDKQIADARNRLAEAMTKEAAELETIDHQTRLRKSGLRAETKRFVSSIKKEIALLTRNKNETKDK